MQLLSLESGGCLELSLSGKCSLSCWASFTRNRSQNRDSPQVGYGGFFRVSSKSAGEQAKGAREAKERKNMTFDSPHRLLWEYELYQGFVLVGSNPGMGAGGVDLGGVANLQASPDKTACFNRGRGCKATLSLAAGGCFLDRRGNLRGANHISHTLHGQCCCFFPRVILYFPGFISTWLIKPGLHRTSVFQVLEGLGKLNYTQMTDWPHRVGCCPRVRALHSLTSQL